jgi:hypothetical protein
MVTTNAENKKTAILSRGETFELRFPYSHRDAASQNTPK